MKDSDLSPFPAVLHNVTGNRDVNKRGPFATKAAVLVSL